MLNIIEELTLKEIGDRIKHIRETRRMTMTELGLSLGRSTNNAAGSLVKNIEGGTRKTLQETEVEEIIELLKISKEDFIAAIPLNKAQHTDIHPLYTAVPGIEEFVDALGLAQRMEDKAMEKMVLGHIKNQIEKAISE